MELVEPVGLHARVLRGPQVGQRRPVPSTEGGFGSVGGDDRVAGGHRVAGGFDVGLEGSRVELAGFDAQPPVAVVLGEATGAQLLAQVSQVGQDLRSGEGGVTVAVRLRANCSISTVWLARRISAVSTARRAGPPPATSWPSSRTASVPGC